MLGSQAGRGDAQQLHARACADLSTAAAIACPRECLQAVLDASHPTDIALFDNVAPAVTHEYRHRTHQPKFWSAGGRFVLFRHHAGQDTDKLNCGHTQQRRRAAGKPDAQRHVYALAPVGLGVGDTMSTLPTAPVLPGSTKRLSDLPTGTRLHNIEIREGQGGIMCRSAGTCATLIKNGDDGRTLLQLPSGACTFPLPCRDCAARCVAVRQLVLL